MAAATTEQWEPTGDEATQFWAKTPRVDDCGYCGRRIRQWERVLVDTIVGRQYCEPCVAAWEAAEEASRNAAFTAQWLASYAELEAEAAARQAEQRERERVGLPPFE